MKANVLMLSSLNTRQTLFLNASSWFKRASTITASILFVLFLSSFASAQSALSEPNRATEELRVLNARRNGWVQVPGMLVRPDCVHEVPLGADVDMKGNVKVGGVIVAHYDACSEAPVKTRQVQNLQRNIQPPETDGWVEDIKWQAPLASTDNIDYMYSYWTVPNNPILNNGLIYLFNGIEPDTRDWILQPVLQYGYNKVFSWQIGAWLVSTNGYIFHSPFFNVSPGDQLGGFTWITSQSGGTIHWEVYISDSTSGTYAWITAHGSGLHWTWAYAGVLEVNTINSCAEYPNSYNDTFNYAAVYHGYPNFTAETPSWSGEIVLPNNGPSCGFYVGVGTTGGTLFWVP